MDETELFKAGIREYRAGNLEEASELLQKSLEIDDQNPKAWNTLGIVFTKAGQYDDAATCYENALMLDPGNETFEKNNRINESKRNDTKNPNEKTPKPASKPNNTSNFSDVGYLDKIKKFLFNSKEAYNEIEGEEWTEGLFFILPLIVIYGILTGFVFGASISFITIIILIIFCIIGSIIGLFLNAIITHIGVIIFSGGQNSGWEGTLKVIIYSLIPFFLIGWIPWIGPIIAGLFGFFLIITGLKQIHGLSTIRALLSIFGIFIFVVIIVIFAAVIAAFVFGMAGSTQTDSGSYSNINKVTPIPTVEPYKATQIQTKTPTQPPTPIPTKKIETTAPITVPYDDLLREPEKYENKNIEITGTVIQAIDDQSIVQSNLGSDGQDIMVIANFEEAMYGAQSENYFLICIDRPLGKRIIQGDEVKLVFSSTGLYTYPTAEGAIATVPSGIVKSGTII